METLIQEKITTKNFDEILKEIKSENDDFSNFLVLNGVGYVLDEWLTIREYTKMYNIQNTNVVSNWIKRGVIPPNCILQTKLNGLKLIKNQKYH